MRIGPPPVLWNVGSDDWKGGDGAAIAARVLGQLRPVILLHDGIGNSAATVASVPTIVDSARKRRYCFVELDRTGAAKNPKDKVLVQSLYSERKGRAYVHVTVAFDGRVGSRVRPRVKSANATALAGTDYARVRRIFSLSAGVRSIYLRILVTPASKGERSFLPRLRETGARRGRSAIKIGDRTVEIPIAR